MTGYTHKQDVVLVTIYIRKEDVVLHSQYVGYREVYETCLCGKFTFMKSM